MAINTSGHVSSSKSIITDTNQDPVYLSVIGGENVTLQKAQGALE